MSGLLKNLTLMCNRRAMLKSIRDEDAVKVAVDFLNDDKIIAIPTDTVYGLCCDFRSAVSLKKIREIKGRPEQKPIAICVSSVSEIAKWAKRDHLPDTLLDRMLPGATTLVLESSARLKREFPMASDRIGIRVPKHDFVLSMLAEFARPIALTSANFSNCTSTTTVDEFADLVPLMDGGAVFDAGPIENNREAKLPSTVVDLSADNEKRAVILRTGQFVDNLCDLLKSHDFFISK